MNYIETLIHKRSPIDEEVQRVIIKDLFEHFVGYEKQLLYINDGLINKVSNKEAFEVMAYQHLSMQFEDVEIKTYNEQKDTEKWNLKIKDIYHTILSRNYYELLTYESDLFSSNQKVIRDEVSKTITVVTNKVHIKEPLNLVSKNDYMEIVKDYKKHFPYFDELLALIVDMRFAKDRKASFLHLRVKSNWGKSFLSGLLQNLQIAIEIDYHNLMNKGANDIAPIQLRNTFVTILDEFNNFSQEMKKLSHSFSLAPKFGMTEKVEMFLKILMSAEKSPSFSGGVDDQIVNRVMVMDISDKEAKKLDDREVYKKHGNDKYMSALVRYAYLKITDRINSYLKLDRFEAHRTADNRCKEALHRYKMKDVSNLNENVKLVIKDEINAIFDLTDIELTPRHREIKKNLIELEDGNIFVRQPKRTIENILKNSVSESEYKKMRFKLSELESILDIIGDYTKRPYRHNGKNVKGLIIGVGNEVEEPPIKNHKVKEPPNDF